MPMPKPDCPRLGTGIASAENRRLRRLLRIFVTIVCTNLVGLASALAEDAPLTPIPSIDLSLTNQLITVQALITNIREPTGPRSPYIVTLTESNATVPLVYWSDMETQLSSKVKLGNIINAEVKVSTYRHNIQLRISSNDAIRVVGTAPIPAASTNTPAAGASPPAPSTNAAPTNIPVAGASPSARSTNAALTTSSPPAPVATGIGKIKEDWVGRVVVISGTISGSGSTDKGRRFSLRDATGEIQILLGQTVLAGLPADKLQPGQALTITGPVKLLDGKLAVIPETRGAVKLPSSRYY